MTAGSLPFSRESDLAANREARFSSRQLVGLVYSGLWRLLLGLPTAAVAAAAAFNHDFWVMAVGIGFAGGGLYLSWRGFSFLGDAITRNVAVVTGPILRYSFTSKGVTNYYVMVGPVQRRVWRKTYQAVPDGFECHAYYASGSQRLLSVEPATASEPHPDLGFGGDAAHAWDRIRWPLVFTAVGLFGLAAGIHGMVTAHAVHPYVLSGTISGYEEHHGRGAYRHVFLTGSGATYSLDNLDSYSPPIPYLGGYIGSQVDLYINPDTDGGVIALRLREQLYAGDYYKNPGDQTRDMTIAGVLIVGLSAAILAGALWWQARARGSVNERLASYAASRSNVTSTSGL